MGNVEYNCIQFNIFHLTPFSDGVQHCKWGERYCIEEIKARLIACLFVSQRAMFQKTTLSTIEVVCMALQCTVTSETDTTGRTILPCG